MNYALGVDGISMPLIVLTTLINVIVVISAWEVIQDRTALYLGAFQIMTGLMIGVFSALDAILFYVFFEATLIPMFLIIGIWGGPRVCMPPSSSFFIPFWARCSCWWRLSICAG